MELTQEDLDQLVGCRVQVEGPSGFSHGMVDSAKLYDNGHGHKVVEMKLV